MLVETRLKNALAKRVSDGNLRQLKVSAGIDFFSNDYLGLASTNYPLVEQHLETELHKIGTKNNLHGSTGSRLLSGNSEYVLQTEKMLAKWFGGEKALLFNSGYVANTAILSAVPQKGDTILYDELCHASLKEGARLSFAHRYSFKHNDLADLSQKLERIQSGCVFVVAETVYSMDGDFAPLKSLVELCKKYQANLIIDEAHSTGLWGAAGSGLVCELGLEKAIFARIYTFGKAIGGHGACIVGSEALVQYLVNFARPFIYTTAMPLQSVAYIVAAFRCLAQTPNLAQKLHENINYFKQNIERQGLKNIFIESNSPIQMLKVAGNDMAKATAEKLQAQGYNLRPVLAPTVAQGQERIRICLHSQNTQAEMHGLLEQIALLVSIPDSQ